jgi:ubiquinone/menaquinone biosynthesis C-methylase UbiE
MIDPTLVRIPDGGVTEQLVTFADDYVLEKAGRGKVLLDIGCGRGVFTEKLTGNFKKVVGIDIIKNEIMSGAQGARQGMYLTMDAHCLGFKNDVFDTIISRYVFHHLDLQKASREIKRCLKPGGILVVIDTEETFWSFRNRVCYFVFGVHRIGIINFCKLLPAFLGYFFTKDTLRHRREDIKRLKKEKRFALSDFIKTYKTFFPGAEVGVYRWAGCVIWKKPNI